MSDNLNWIKELFELKKQAFDESIKQLAGEYGLNPEKLKQMFEKKRLVGSREKKLIF